MNVTGEKCNRTPKVFETTLQHAQILVGSRDTPLHHTGDLKIPLAARTIIKSDSLADLCRLNPGAAGRPAPNDITVFKNSGDAILI